MAKVFTLLTLLPSAGTFSRPLFAEDGVTCNGVETTDGTKYYADKVVLATGAWSPTLIDLEDQCVSKVRHDICIGGAFSHRPYRG
jgi:hypothetical protein